MHERSSTELELIQSMYPDQVTYKEKSQELIYTTLAGKLQLRLPDNYLESSLPEVLYATACKKDQRCYIKAFISDNCAPGEEVLDSIIAHFNDLVETCPSEEEYPLNLPPQPDAKATVIIWLHHLLNTSKRKQALSPPSPSVSGISKPGYPGVLVYSGNSAAVHEHVDELKGLNWQAFQVRFESDEEWTYRHGNGVIEVEAMKDVVADVGEKQKEVFMEAMRMK